MTEFGLGPDLPPEHQVMTVGTSGAGEVLAGRYRLEEHINNDAHGRQVWRGLDVVLRRPIAVVLRHPGGPPAEEMLAAAVAASRITHPHLVDVYDAVDEGNRAYVVREWVDGVSLRELVADGPLDAGRATTVAHAVASAVAAAHATRMVHGNLQPGTVLIADDGRVVLADARADDDATYEADVRAIGAILYCALTGHWPHQEAGPDRLPDGARDANGALASPRQMRGGLPSYLSELATDLLDPAIPPPTSEALAAELGRLDSDGNDEFFGDGGPLGFVTPLRPAEPDMTGRSGRKIAIGVAALLLISAVGLVIGLKLAGPGKAGAAGTPPTSGGPQSSAPPSNPPTTGGAVALQPDQVRIVEPKGDNTERGGAAAMVDGNPDTNWHTDRYRGDPRFGNLKSGMGVLLNLGKPTNVANVVIDFDTQGATVSAYVGSSDPGATNTGDQQILKDYKLVADPQTAGVADAIPIGQTTQYLLIWISSLPPDGAQDPGWYRVTINEIKVNTGSS